jgi:hypothetical protein
VRAPSNARPELQKRQLSHRGLRPTPSSERLVLGKIFLAPRVMVVPPRRCQLCVRPITQASDADHLHVGKLPQHGYELQTVCVYLFTLLIIQHRTPGLVGGETDAIFQAVGPSYSDGVNDLCVWLVTFEEVRHPF